MQLPMFPAGVTEINRQLAVENRDGKVYYVYGHVVVFAHDTDDIQGFRMFTSQLIANGTAKTQEIVKTFGVPLITVKRYVRVYREQGSEGFYVAKPRHSSASVLKGDVLEQAQQRLEQGHSIPAIARELQILPNTLHKAVRSGRLRAPQKKGGRMLSK